MLARNVMWFIVLGAMSAMVLVGASRVTAETVTINASTDVWIWANSPDTTMENDLVSVWNSGTGWSHRRGVVEFDLSGVPGPITGAYLQLYSVSTGATPNSGTNYDWAIEQKAQLLNPPGADGITWNKGARIK